MKVQHKVRPVTRVSLPERTICMASVIEDDPDQIESIKSGSLPLRYWRILREFGMTILRWSGGMIMDDYDYIPCSPCMLLAQIKSNTKGGHTAWVFGLGIKSQLDAMRAWDWWDSGELSFGPKGGKTKGQTCVLVDPPTIVQARVKSTGGIVRFIDIANFGVCKLDDSTTVRKSVISVCGWLESYMAMLVDNNMGSFRYTAASQAWHSFRRLACPADMIIHNNAEVTAFERNSLYGGRNECLELRVIDSTPEHGKIIQLDINSSYVSCAKDALIPVEFMTKCKPTQCVFDKMVRSENVGVIADVSLETTVAMYPRRICEQTKGGGEYGLRHGSVIYPVGRIRTTLAGPELRMAYDLGHVRQIHAASVYRTGQIFTKWTDIMWPIYLGAKSKNRHGAKATLKAIMLGLYGRFAGMAKEWKDHADCYQEDKWRFWHRWNDTEKVMVSWRCISGHVQSYTGDRDGHESFPAVTAWINSLGRVRLMKLLGIAGLDNVYYYDTDSIWTNRYGLRQLRMAGEIDQDQLGKLKIVSEYDKVEFIRQKWYIADGREVKSGVNGTLPVKRSPPLNVEISSGNSPRSIEVKETVRNCTKYVHGVVQGNGRVGPIHVNDW